MKGIFYIILACFLWASDTLIRYPLIAKGITPLTVVFLEHAFLLTLFLIPLVKNWKNFFNLRISEILLFFVIGVFGSGLSTLAFTRAFSYLNPSLVILLQKFQPVIAILLAHFVLSEPINKKFLYCAVICLIGALMIGHQEIENILYSGNSIENSLQGYFLVFISIVGWGATTVFGKKISLSNFTTMQIMAGRYLFGFLFLAPLFFEADMPMPAEAFDVVKVFIMVLLSGLAGMYFYYRGMQYISARSVALSELFFPFCAVLVNWLFLSKTLTPIQLCGGGLLLLGSTLIQLRKY